MSSETEPNPGSDEAVALGCTCPVMDNNHGAGTKGLEGCFWYTSGCPVHWAEGTTLGPFISAAMGAPSEHSNE